MSSLAMPSAEPWAKAPMAGWSRLNMGYSAMSRMAVASTVLTAGLWPKSVSGANKSMFSSHRAFKPLGSTWKYSANCVRLSGKTIVPSSPMGRASTSVWGWMGACTPTGIKTSGLWISRMSLNSWKTPSISPSLINWDLGIPGAPVWSSPSSSWVRSHSPASLRGWKRKSTIFAAGLRMNSTALSWGMKF